jgi:EmrB/QacA subfamily drug resistance transporter
MAPQARPDRWKLLPVLLLAPFMGSLDGSIVNVALPTIADRLGVDIDGVQWVVSIYLIVISALVLVLVFGKIADKLGKVRVFNLGFLLFGTGSFLCSISWSLPILIAARSSQAVGASMFMSSNQGIIATIFPPEERGRALGFLGTTVAIGTMVGPPLGGIMVGLFNWQSLFIINIPISIFAFISGLRLLPRDDKPGSLAGFDLLGTGLFGLFVFSLFYFMLNGGQQGARTTLELASLGLSIVSGFLFVIREKRVADPMIDLSIFRDGFFSISVACVLLVFVVSFCVTIVQPFYLQDVLGQSPAAAGLLLLATPLASGLIAPLSGHLSDRVGAKALTVVGLAVILAGLGLLSLFGLGTSPPAVAGGLALFGLGGGVFSAPNTKLIMSHAPKDKLGIAGSVNALARNMGMVSGIAFAVTLLNGSMSARLGRSVSGFVPEAPEAFVFGMRVVFLSAAALCAVAIALTLARAMRSDSGYGPEQG